MDCPECGKTLKIGNSYMTFKNDDSPEKQTEAYQNLPMLCTNKKCIKFAGKNLSMPEHVVDIISLKLN